MLISFQGFCKRQVQSQTPCQLSGTGGGGEGPPAKGAAHLIPAEHDRFRVAVEEQHRQGGRRVLV